MAERDPYALRFAVALLAFAAAVVAGPEMYGRLASAFDWRGEAAQAAAAARIDAWIDPPPYAGRPPVVIDLKTADPQTLTVPEDSVLVVRGDPSVVATRVEGAIAPAEQKARRPPSAPTQAPNARPRPLRPKSAGRSMGAGKATILRGGDAGGERRHRRHAGRQADDRAHRGPSRQSQRHADARLPDRTTVSGSPAPGRHSPGRTRPPAPPRARCARRRRRPCELPPTDNGAGEARTTVDLSEHPWAGAKVTMTLSAISISGKTGESAPVELTLPQRIFHNPLARALVEQRRNLILDPDHAPKRVETALTALTIAPELFDTPANVYLGLKQAKTSLGTARSDADLLDVAAMLVGDGAADRERRRDAGRARPARRRAGAARSA